MPKISQLPSYTNPHDADVQPIVDTTNATTKKITWSSIKTALKSFFDTIYEPIINVLPISKGGTGASTVQGARTNILPPQTGNAGKFLKTDGTDVLWDDAVTGPNSSTNNAVVLFDGTTGKVIKDSAKLLPSGNIVGDTDAQSLSNKRIYPRQLTQTSPTSITPDKSQFDEYYVTALANAITINNATSPSVGDTFVIYLTDNGTARSISWGSHYVGLGGALPTSTTANKTMEIIIKYVTTTKALVSTLTQQ
jgi:hypothetical protein